MSRDDDESGAARLLGHEDVDLFTFLPAPRMQRISNDIFPSTTHRVSKPRDAAARTEPRISFPMAVYVWEDEILEVLPGIADPKYPPVKAIDLHTGITSKFYGDDYAVKAV